jgi:hypothetical protein
MPKFRILVLTIIVLLFELSQAVRVDRSKIEEKKSEKDRKGKSKSGFFLENSYPTKMSFMDDLYCKSKLFT